jgi:predicted nucleic acid-binding Zn ribbon protein
MTTHCLECEEPIKGRSDKKFCSDACRNAYNNKFNKDSTNLMRNVNRVLRKNRLILKELNPTGKSKVKKNTLLHNGFDFTYHTNIYTTKTGKQYYFCYEQGYLLLDHDFIALVQRQEYVR